MAGSPSVIGTKVVVGETVLIEYTGEKLASVPYTGPTKKMYFFGAGQSIRRSPVDLADENYFMSLGIFKRVVVQLRYVGALSGSWKGPITTLNYVVAGPNVVLQVEIRDAACMLEWKDPEGNPYFQQV